MSAPRTVEESLLQPAERLLNRITSGAGAETNQARISILEAAASRLGSFNLSGYRSIAGAQRPLSTSASLAAADQLVTSLLRLPFHPSLALTALARPVLGTLDRRKTGAYYTDYRLAQYLASLVARREDLTVIDPASGTGILLVAVALRLCGSNSGARSTFVRRCVHAADLSEEALQGVALALASLTSDLGAVEEMLPRLKRTDSLLDGPAAWAREAPEGFGLVIGNPPWEKLKVTRHEFDAANGAAVHYGADRFSDADASPALAEEKERLVAYRDQVAAGLTMQGSGESDLYKAFLELSLQLAAPGGEVALLLPAGLIRSQGTGELRKSLLRSALHLGLTIFENRARFFSIDTRFKFLAVHAVKSQDRPGRSLTLTHASATDGEIRAAPAIRISRPALAVVRPDLSVPELRSRAEWRMFRRMARNGRPFGADDAIWKPKIVREVDMTRDRALFARTLADGRFPLVEGRMVHQHRFGAKAYVSGTGRRAIWSPLPPGTGTVAPQFWIDPGKLRKAVRLRCEQPRVGFCDVTGQTNERSILAARIPARVVCGNKVPTITFDNPRLSASERNALGYLWLATANSIALDWFARRVITTSVNYFLLLALPFPDYDLDSLAAQRLVSLARQLERADQQLGQPDPWALAELRAEIDVHVLTAYRLGVHHLRLMLDDFPLLDRAQPPLEGESRSTVTRDLVMARAAELAGSDPGEHGRRAALARARGAIPYFPSEFGVFDPIPDEEDEVNYG
ncbi:MAG TPA: N-6 DNA methylase [Longimicrobium sp.]